MTLRAHRDRYRVPLAAAFETARLAFAERRGTLLTLEEDGGRCGRGEAAPLPGYSDDALESAEALLDVVDFTGLPPLSELDRVARWIEGRLPRHAPSARSALETALLELAAVRRSVPLHALLAEPDRAGPSPRPLSALVAAGPREAVEAEVAGALVSGFTTVKLKVGKPGAFEQELLTLRALRRAHGSALRLRLDANGAFPPDEASARLRALADLEPELVEDPVPRGVSLLESPPVPVALDEVLRDPLPDFGALRERYGVVAVVLKPTVLGGLLACRRLARAARGSGIATIVSHTFEGPVGYAAACELALSLPESPFAEGLAPHSGLGPWGALPAALSGARLVPHDRPGLGLRRLSVLAP
ncbi:MAG TPA: enolase C-terminal domain-like protein [Polyangiaceae bacterium]|nr:enolase C-terminal domain-like protein [Polyangiaceae bacterium]